jgi:C-terminal processing protease CtpA/Prc
MFFDAVAPLTFIGSPTAGANGDITDTILPGNIQLLFSGQEIRHADGRPLQRVGIQPHIPSAPTLAGLRAGRDDVLDRAIEFARTGK